jgi:ABC-type multidrug transport system ATPase subunit/ABC-type multidrug transport system permease subunit
MKISVHKKGNSLAEISIEENKDGEWLIGRDATADISLADTQISRRHAILKYVSTGQFYITDLGSTNGTFVNNKRIESDKPFTFSISDSVHLSENAGISLIIIVSETEPSQKNQSIINPHHQSVVDVMIHPIKPSPKDITHSQDKLIDLLNEKNRIVIGRSSECDFILNQPSISRKHASLEKKNNNAFILTDLDSTNGTYVNGKKISGSVQISADDVIFIGRYSLSLHQGPKDLSREIAVKAQGIKKEFGKGKVGLHESTIEINAKALLAIMGPSGCGKSTLLKVLNGDSPATNGKVYICGLELNRNYEYLKTLIGYVPQDDIVHMDLTVEQCLYYAAHLRIENGSDEVINQKIEQVLDQLKIQEIRHNQVGKISGGQRKRVSIAVEILNDPVILFLDEPTSPLDPQTIEEFLEILRSLAAKGTTVIMVTHKTDDLLFMDSVIFMAEGGHVAYHGDTKNYLNHFGVKNTVNVYSNLGGEHSKKWIENYQSQQTDFSYQTDASPVQKKSINTNYINQYWWLTKRYFRIKLNDRINTMIMIGQAPIIALLLCLIFKEISQVILFLIAISAIWFGTNNAAREIVGEMPVYKRERMYNLGILPYILSKATVLTSFAALQSLIFISIISLRYPGWESFGSAFLWMLFLSFSATLLGLMLSAIVNTTEKVMSIVPIVLIPQIMLSGIFVKIQNTFVELLSYLTFSRWGTEGFSILQSTIYIPKPVYNEQTKLMESSTIETMPVNALSFLSKQFHPDFKQYYGTFRADFTAIALISLILFVLVYYFLKKKDSIKT